MKNISFETKFILFKQRQTLKGTVPAGINFYGNTRSIFKSVIKSLNLQFLILKIYKKEWRRSDIVIVNLEQMLNIVLSFSLIILNKQMSAEICLTQWVLCFYFFTFWIRQADLILNDRFE